MRSFNLGSFDNDDGWFRVGGVAATTTMILTAVGVFSMFVFAGGSSAQSLLDGLAFLPDKVLSGQIWRIFTWPVSAFPPGGGPSIWSILTLVFFFIFGSQLERRMGRSMFTTLLIAATIIPAVTMTVLSIGYTENFLSGAGYLGVLSTGILCAFIACHPEARFFGSIPGWVIALVIVGLNVLSSLGLGLYSRLLFELLVVAVAVLGVRAMGFAEETPQIPKVPLPPSLGGNPYRKSDNERKATQKGKGSSSKVRKKKNRTGLKAVPTPPPAPIRDGNNVDEREMDDLLDQVSSGGLGSLTGDQRRRLEELSKKLKGDS